MREYLQRLLSPSVGRMHGLFKSIVRKQEELHSSRYRKGFVTFTTTHGCKAFALS